jgi:hypothetical protein
MDYKKNSYFCVPGEMAEWSNAAVLKTVVPSGTGGSNPSLSASKNNCPDRGIFVFEQMPRLIFFLHFQYFSIFAFHRRAAGVVERGRLEICCTA